MGFELGRTYSGYEFLDIIKRTGTTVAHRVRNTLADREELLYALGQGGDDDPRRRERFMREMALRARLVHPNIPAFLNAMELNGCLVMTTEFVDGRTLGEVLKSGTVPRREACRLAGQVLSALACAHDFNIVHRDISPESIMITADGAVALCDFALAKGLSSPQLTQVGAIFGNAAYIAPEQARGTGELDCRTDIYSVGAVLYHMLCGRPPFVAKSEFELMVAHVKEAPNPPSFFCAAVPQAFDTIVLKALAKDPAQRYVSCEEFAEALAAASAAPEKPQIEGECKRPGSRFNRLVLYGVAVTLAMALLVVWFLVRA